MKILHLTHSSSRIAGGLFNSVRQLALQTSGFLGSAGQVDVVSFADAYSKEDAAAWGRVIPRHYTSLIGPSYGASPGMLVGCLRGKYDVVHTHGIWSSISWVAWACGKAGARVIVSPRGMVDPWILQRSRGRKLIIGGLIEKRLMRTAHVVHALAASEEAAIRNYCPGARVERIPNAAADLTENSIFHPERTAFRLRSHRPLSLLFFGRLHEKKGLNQLLDALSLLRGRGVGPAELILNIFGWGQEDFVRSLEERIGVAGLRDQVFLRGSAYGDAKVRAFAHADIFILPSRSEGLPMAALEAASAELPLLLTSECNLPEFNGSGAQTIGLSSESIADGIVEFLSANDRAALNTIGACARRTYQNGFSWPSVISQYMKIYEG